MRSFIFILFGFITLSFTPDKFVKVEVTEGITVFLPADFIQPPQEEINKRMQSPRIPLIFYTDPNNEVDFSVNMSYSLWAQKDIEILRSFYRSTILSLYDEVNFIKDEIVEVDGRQYAEFEFESKVEDDEESIIQKGPVRKYTLIRYTILKNNNTVLLNFTCPLYAEKKWNDTAREIMDKAVIK